MSMLPSLPNRRTMMTVAAVTVVVAAASPSVRHTAETVLKITLITVAVAAGVAALAAVAVIVIGSYRRPARDQAGLPLSRAPSVGRPVAAIPAPPLSATGEPDRSLAEALAFDETERDLARP